MRKILLLATAIICTLSLSAASYGIKVNGTDYHAGTLNPSPLDPSFTEYSVLSVEIANGSTLQIWDADNNAGWAVNLDGASVKTIVKDGNHYNCTADGCYDFYIKLKWGNDQLYIGNGSCGGGGGGGTGCQDGPYDLCLNGVSVGTFVDGGFAPDGETPQLNLSARIKVGDKVQFCNTSCTTPEYFFPGEIETGGDVDGSGNFTFADGYATCKVDGCYNFWWKKIYGADKLYIGTDGNCPNPFDPDKAYYIAGNGVTGSAWCCGEDWSENACKLENNTVTYNNLPAGEYTFKITNGTWASNWGAESLDLACSADGVSGDADGNVFFKVYKKANVTITFDGKICVKITGDEKPDVPPERPSYPTSVPQRCPDVMLQAFYYDSYDDKAPGNVTYKDPNTGATTKVGDTKWSTLLKNSADIGLYFDMVWLPPSGKSEGGTGYHQTQYSNQNSAWGTKGELVEFINRMHANNTKVIADIVINHAGCMSSWCDFYPQYFSPYGTFNPDASWICKTDEVNGQSEDLNCKGAATGTDDGGYNGQDNYASARDWAHADTRVQNMMKAYLKWMKNVMGFDGWRYDYAQGFKGKYINMYNSAAANYFSVTEFWNNDTKGYLSDCNWNTTTFDFGNKYAGINKGIADGEYTKCQGSGLSGTGDGRLAVTFVDSHDTYFGCTGGREDQSEIGGCGKSMEDYNKDRVLGANAYILSRPGIPCVFWPHWRKYGNEIKKMVMARQATGIHSESEVSEESAQDKSYYKATITGTKGSIRLLIGPNSGYNDTPSGYSLAYKGGNFAMYYKLNDGETPRVTITPSQTYKTTNFNVTMTAAALSGTPTIYYTTDGTDPTEASTKYTGAITINGTKTVKAIAVLNGKKSAVITSTYTYKEPQTTPITLRFQHDNTWTGDVYIFAWDGASTGAWPGQKASIGVDGWYTYQCAASVKSTKFIWNNGKTGKLQTADLETDCDVCYKWASGCEEIDPECGEIEVPFGIAISPESTKFKDKNAGIDVTITAVGVPVGGQATIYYTTDGTNPTTSSTSSKTNPVKLNFKKTTELRAMAVSGNKTTEIVKAVYTYKEPQTTPIIVKFRNTGNWKKVNLYAWTTDGSETPVLGQWPGTEITAKDAEGSYYHQFDAQYKSMNIIWNNGTAQSGDIMVDEDACFMWDGSDAVLVDCGEMAIDNVELNAPKLDPRAPMYNVLGQRVDATYVGIVIQNGYKYLIIK